MAAEDDRWRTDRDRDRWREDERARGSGQRESWRRDEDVRGGWRGGGREWTGRDEAPWTQGNFGGGRGPDDDRGADWRGGQGYGPYGRGSGEYGPSRYPGGYWGGEGGWYGGARGEGPGESRGDWPRGRDERFWRGYPDYGRDWSDRDEARREWGGRDRGGERSFWDRASDEVSSWFGDENAERRRRMDEIRSGAHRGRGPRGYSRSDERIREDVCDRLTDDPMVDASGIDVTVSGGEVTLSGTVDSRAARRRAEDVAERVSGVSHLQNDLRVQQQGSPTGTGTGSMSGTGMVPTNAASADSSSAGSTAVETTRTSASGTRKRA